MNATSAVGVLVLATTVGCAADPNSSSPTATPPMVEEACDSDVLARALAAVHGVKGYRFTQEIPGPVRLCPRAANASGLAPVHAVRSWRPVAITRRS